MGMGTAEPALMPTLADELALITDVARQAGAMAMRHFGRRDLDVRLKDGESPVTHVDLAVDRFLRETLTAARPHYGWLSEETADSDIEARMTAARTFIVDPIDGTRAFIDGYEVWCVSVALVENGYSVAGVLECPALQETITAVADGGAMCNDAPLHIAAPAAGAELVVGGPRSLVDRLDVAGHGVRRHRHVPSLAYRLSMVARGAMHATFVKPYSSDWDVAAAGLVLQEAGGVFVDAHGEPVAYNKRDPLKGTLVGCHPDLTEAMMSVVGDLRFG